MGRNSLERTPLNSVLGGLQRLLSIAGAVLALVGCTKDDDYLWLQGHWVTDLQVSLLANPHIQDFPSDDRKRWLDSYSTLRWNVTNEVISVIHEKGQEASVSYSIESNNKGEAILHMVSDDGLETSLYLWPTKTGFCNKTASIEYVITPKASREMESVYGKDDPFTRPGRKTTEYLRDDPVIAVECYKRYEP